MPTPGAVTSIIGGAVAGYIISLLAVPPQYLGLRLLVSCASAGIITFLLLCLLDKKN